MAATDNRLTRAAAAMPCPREVKDALDAIARSPKIAIYTHINPDGDCNGSAFGLRELILENVGRDKKILVAGVRCPENLRFLGPYDEISDEFARQALSIVVDTSAANRVSDQRFKTASFVIKIDHHLDSERMGTVNIEEAVPACALQIYDFANHAGWHITKKAALPLLTGLITDTGRFRHLRAHAKRTLDAAAALVQTGIDVDKEIFANLYVRDPGQFPFTSWYLRNVKITGRVAHIIIPRSVLVRYGRQHEDAAQWLFNMADLKGVEAWGQFTQYPDHWRCEYRSKGYPVNELAKRFGGGGHRQASGSTAKNLAEVKRIVQYMKGEI